MTYKSLKNGTNPHKKLGGNPSAKGATPKNDPSTAPKTNRDPSGNGASNLDTSFFTSGPAAPLRKILDDLKKQRSKEKLTEESKKQILKELKKESAHMASFMKKKSFEQASDCAWKILRILDIKNYQQIKESRPQEIARKIPDDFKKFAAEAFYRIGLSYKNSQGQHYYLDAARFLECAYYCNKNDLKTILNLTDLCLKTPTSHFYDYIKRGKTDPRFKNVKDIGDEIRRQHRLAINILRTTLKDTFKIDTTQTIDKQFSDIEKIDPDIFGNIKINANCRQCLNTLGKLLLNKAQKEIEQKYLKTRRTLLDEAYCCGVNTALLLGAPNDSSKLNDFITEELGKENPFNGKGKYLADALSLIAEIRSVFKDTEETAVFFNDLANKIKIFIMQNEFKNLIGFGEAYRNAEETDPKKRGYFKQANASAWKILESVGFKSYKQLITSTPEEFAQKVPKNLGAFVSKAFRWIGLVSKDKLLAQKYLECAYYCNKNDLKTILDLTTTCLKTTPELLDTYRNSKGGKKLPLENPEKEARRQHNLAIGILRTVLHNTFGTDTTRTIDNQFPERLPGMVKHTKVTTDYRRCLYNLGELLYTKATQEIDKEDTTQKEELLNEAYCCGFNIALLLGVPNDENKQADFVKTGLTEENPFNGNGENLARAFSLIAKVKSEFEDTEETVAHFKTLAAKMLR